MKLAELDRIELAKKIEELYIGGPIFLLIDLLTEKKSLIEIREILEYLIENNIALWPLKFEET